MALHFLSEDGGMAIVIWERVFRDATSQISVYKVLFVQGRAGIAAV